MPSAINRLSGALILGLIGLVLTGVGYYVGHYLGGPLLRHAKASTAWPGVPGKITASSVEHDTRRDNKTHKIKHSYRQHIEYVYSIDGQEHTADVVWFGDDYSSNSRGAHEAVVNRYPLGKAVTVFHDPADPKLAVLEPGAKFSSYLLYGMGWVLTIVGVILMLGGVKTLASPSL